MPRVPKQTRANRANGAKAKVRHEAAQSMEQLTAAHATLTVGSCLSDLICKLMVVAVVGQQLVMPDLGWVATEGGMHAFELARHVEQLLDNLLDASTQDAEERFPYIFKHALGLFVATAPSAHTAAGSLLTAAASAPNPMALEGPQQWAAAKPKLVVLINKHIQALLQHTKHGNSAKQGLDAMIGSIINKLDPGALDNIDLADFEARLLTLRKQKRDKETASADDNREAKATRKTEESACMVDGNAKMVLNVPTQAPLQQLQQAFQQHARGADYSNTSAKEATRFTREQLRAYLLYHKVPPRDQPVGNTLVAGWQKAVQKHIAERGSPTGHGLLDKRLGLAMEYTDLVVIFVVAIRQELQLLGKGVLLPHLRWVLAVLLDVCL
ncbi:hypothetical protein QJQ45_024596 [Haematococcus lacustris]|nr:hypothetical protein QJQ45_024596 [Haematococcus lacustris]